MRADNDRTVTQTNRITYAPQIDLYGSEDEYPHLGYQLQGHAGANGGIILSTLQLHFDFSFPSPTDSPICCTLLPVGVQLAQPVSALMRADSNPLADVFFLHL